MIRERGEPAIADTSKPIIEPPVFPDYPTNTPTTRDIADDPDLVGGNADDEDETDDDLLLDEDEDLDETGEEFGSGDIDDREVVIEDGDEIIETDPDEEDDEF